jgi:formiminotetrahydrofolate cyclodeaminase
VFIKASGLVPLIVMHNRKKVVMTLKTLFYLGNKISVSRTSTGFFMYVGGKSFSLENFDLLLKGEISEGDFREDLEKNNPDNYQEIWEILTIGGPFLAFYY